MTEKKFETTIACEFKDCIHNDREFQLCRCCIIAIIDHQNEHPICDSYMKTPKILERHFKKSNAQ